MVILDDDDEWKENHVESCLDAAERNGDDCKWVVSGILRKRSNGGYHEEPIPDKKPSPKDFFDTNPGIQGSNLFVNCGLLVQAGMFDEALPSTTDRDLCIRLCDLLHNSSEKVFASTGTRTVIHYADGTHNRVSTRGSQAKIDGLKLFYFKYAPRMNATQRRAFKNRAKDRFDCDLREFQVDESTQQQMDAWTVLSWSGDALKLNRFTKALLPPLEIESDDANDKKDAIIGIISGDIRRLEPLLKDLGHASKSPNSDFSSFVVVFANTNDVSFAGLVRGALISQSLRGYVLDATNDVVPTILKQCHSHHALTDTAIAFPLPICLGRTVLQVFIFHLTTKELGNSDAVVILDDDKRLLKGWSPFCDGKREAADIQIGRDLRTPPNPTLLSLRTNLLDIIFAFDLAYLKIHSNGTEKEDANQLLRFCRSVDAFAEKFDWYYDKSSSRSDHIEMPVLSNELDSDQGGPFASIAALRRLRSDILVGTPFARDVIPPDNSEPTLQRGGCAVFLKKDDSSYNVLAIEQDAPLLTLADGSVIHSRRSDSLWCKHVKQTKSKKIEVSASLYVYHDNKFDKIPTPSAMRRAMVQEILGAVLCRKKEALRLFKDKTVLELKLWLSRVQGLLKCLRSRPYYNQTMDKEFVQPLEAIFNEDLWKQEVFDVVEREFERLKEFEPQPTDFAFLSAELIRKSDMEEALFQWRRIEDALKTLQGSVAGPAFVGMGHEGVVFQANNYAYKVMDKVRNEDLPDPSILNEFGASLLEGTQKPVIKSPYIHGGRHYRGGHGCELLQLLTWMKVKGVGTQNIAPDNIILRNEQGGYLALKLVDLGRDLFMRSASISCATQYEYEAKFTDMCRRAFLCFRFGSHANTVDGLKILKDWMRKSSITHGKIAQLEGFDTFMTALEESLHVEGKPRHHQLYKQLINLRVRYHLLICASPNSTKLEGTIDANQDDPAVLQSIEDFVLQSIENVVRSSGRNKVAICIESPFTTTELRRPLWWYRRHLKRLGARLSLSLSEENIHGIDKSHFEPCIKYHTFILVATEKPAKAEGSCQDPGCHLMIKSCPLEHDTIVADVRRIVHNLERSSSTFKSIILLVDWSISNGFLRQYTSCDEEDILTYKAAIEQVKNERLVDYIIEFSVEQGMDEACIAVNRRWFGLEECSATHSDSRQQHASTLFGFDSLLGLECYEDDDVVLQCDSDIMFNCDPSLDGVEACLSSFCKDPHLLTLAFPILSKNQPAEMMISDDQGKSYRFEVRCSFIHLARLASMLPLKVPAPERSEEDDGCIKRGWWRVLDENIKDSKWKSCRVSLAGSNAWFFVHPQNDVKKKEGAMRMLAIGDRIANSQVVNGIPSKGHRAVWQEQQGSVDLVCPRDSLNDWLRERNEPFVVVAYGSSVSYGRAMRFLNSLKKQMDGFDEQDIGLILINGGPDIGQDIKDEIRKEAKGVFGNAVSVLNIGNTKGLNSALEFAVDSTCGEDTSVILFARLEGCFVGGGSKRSIWKHFYLHCEISDVASDFDGSGFCMFRKDMLGEIIKDRESQEGTFTRDTAADDGGVFYLKEDGCIVLIGQNHVDCLPAGCFPWQIEKTELPCRVDGKEVMTDFHVSDEILEGNLTIQIIGLVQGGLDIGQAEKVPVRIHSECLTGDVFYSMKCDCGEQKTKFMRLMEESPHAVLLYIKGHEGRGAGISKKIAAYLAMETHRQLNHLEALQKQGCEIDARGYDAAVKFLHDYLKIRSLLVLYSNNPEKIKAVQNVYDTNNFETRTMSTEPTKYNSKYLEEKVEHLDHHPSLIQKPE